jgi:hypothetical protein
LTVTCEPQLLDRVAGAVLLDETEDRAAEDDRQDHVGIDPFGRDDRDRRGHDQDQDRRAPEPTRACAHRRRTAVGTSGARVPGAPVRVPRAYPSQSGRRRARPAQARSACRTASRASDAARRCEQLQADPFDVRAVGTQRSDLAPTAVHVIGERRRSPEARGLR